MNQLNPKNLHHSYGIQGGDVVVLELLSFLEKDLGIKLVGSPDFFHQKYESLGIDDSRRIKEIHSSRSFIQGSKRVFVIECKAMTHEAQNSLLKIFEEPHEDTHFFLVMPSLQNLLPTLRSRLFIIEAKKGIETGEAKKFLKLSQKEKIAFVDELAKDISDEKKEKSNAIEFLSSLEVVLHEQADMNKISPKGQKSLKALLKARDYMADRSPSTKQLLEFVALNL